VIRYATGAKNEASHRLGARHGIEFLFAYRNYWWSPDPAEDPDDPSAFDPDVRAAATALRGRVLEDLASDGRVARPADIDRLWALVSADAGFIAARRLYEARPWAMGELTATLFARHIERGEIVASDTAVAIVLREQLPSEDSSLRLALLVGDIDPAIALLELIRSATAKTVRFRLPEGSPLQSTGHDQLMAAGYRPSDWTLHLLGRPIDADHPIPDVDPAKLNLADLPQPILVPPNF
jgi:hypothetical protein